MFSARPSLEMKTLGLGDSECFVHMTSRIHISCQQPFQSHAKDIFLVGNILSTQLAPQHCTLVKQNISNFHKRCIRI